MHQQSENRNGGLGCLSVIVLILVILYVFPDWEPRVTKKIRARNEGYVARRSGLTAESNPYLVPSESRSREFQEELARDWENGRTDPTHPKNP